MSSVTSTPATAKSGNKGLNFSRIWDSYGMLVVFARTIYRLRDFCA
jgi:L-arabinose transport system permease protein